MESKPKSFFPRVQLAREALRERALEVFTAYMDLADQAKSAGNFEVAEEIYWKLIEHMPAEDGVRLIDSSAAKPKELEGPKGPTIQIGIALNSSTKPKELGPSIVDAEVIKSE